MWLTQKNTVHAMDAKQIPLRRKQQCRWITGLFTLCVLLLVSTADAERASGEERVEKENPRVYSVCFRGCSRSRWQSTSRHSLESAVHEAGDRRQKREQVFIIRISELNTRVPCIRKIFNDRLLQRQTIHLRKSHSPWYS